ncbi:MAG TPA: hypothetical protein VFS60_17045, partial [Thermoanaerobaculia bacterium]|nr:hypothetical protein [Thermoanaerobaculia bacterium]
APVLPPLPQSSPSPVSPPTPPAAAPPAAASPYGHGPLPPAGAAPGTSRRTVVLLASLGAAVLALLVVVAAVGLWNRSPQRPTVQPPAEGGWNPAEGPLPESSLSPAAPTAAPLPMILPPAQAPTPYLGSLGEQQQLPPGPAEASPSQAPVIAVPSATAPVPSPPPATQPPPPPHPPQEAVSQHLRCRRGVEFDIAPGEAQVYLDGRLLGTADEVEQYEMSSMPGRHLLRFTAPGYKPVTVEVEVSPTVRGRWTEVEVEMEELPEEGQDGGR